MFITEEQARESRRKNNYCQVEVTVADGCKTFNGHVFCDVPTEVRSYAHGLLEDGTRSPETVTEYLTKALNKYGFAALRYPAQWANLNAFGFDDLGMDGCLHRVAAVCKVVEVNSDAPLIKIEVGVKEFPATG